MERLIAGHYYNIDHLVNHLILSVQSIISSNNISAKELVFVYTGEWLTVYLEQDTGHAKPKDRKSSHPKSSANVTVIAFS